MRMNIDIPDKLHNEIKIFVTLNRKTMRDFILEALQSKMKDEKKMMVDSIVERFCVDK